MKTPKTNSRKSEKDAYIEDFNNYPPYFPKKETEKIKIQFEKKKYTYIGAAELCLAHGIKQKNMWQKYIVQKGFEIVSVNPIIITNNLDRIKMIKLLKMKHGFRIYELVYFKDDELYKLWKHLTLKK
jgi:hypothetical protein